MTVRELIKRLEKESEDSEVGFAWNGNHVVGSVHSGKMPGQDTGYVLLYRQTVEQKLGIPREHNYGVDDDLE